MPRLLALVLCLVALPAAAELKEGAIAYSRGDLATAIRELKPLAESGLPFAQYLYGVSLLNAKAPLANEKEGEAWLERAASAGNVAAMRDLGRVRLFYKKPADTAGARKWLGEAANRGDAEAQHLLAVSLLDGPAGPEARPEAVMWLQLAAERGHLLSGVLLREVRPPFTDAERAEGERRAAQWKPVR